MKIKKKMKTLNFFAIVGMLLVSFLLTAQNPTTNPTQVPVAPKVIKKLPEKQQAMYYQMAADLKLSEEQKAKSIELAIERAVSLNEKMKTATTDEQKKEIKKQNLIEYNKKLDDAFGVDLAEKLRTWQREYTLKQRALQPKK